MAKRIAASIGRSVISIFVQLGEVIHRSRIVDERLIIFECSGIAVAGARTAKSV